MKKLLFMAAFYCLQSSGRAQFLSREENNSSNNNQENNDYEARNHFGDRSFKPTGYTRALQHFTANYTGIQQTSWMTLPDKGFLCMFHLPGIVNRVHYDKHGNWLFTLSGYEIADLSDEITQEVMDAYGEYRISYVNEIISPAADPIYIINIENAESIKVIKVIGEHIELQQDLEKN